MTQVSSVVPVHTITAAMAFPRKVQALKQRKHSESKIVLVIEGIAVIVQLRNGEIN